MGYPTRLLGDDEVIETQFRPHWSQVIREGLLVLGAAVLAILLSLAEVPAWLIVVLWVLVLAVITRGVIRWLTTLHVITNERVIYRAGFIAKRGTEIPLEVVNDVAFNQTLFERVFGTGDLLIESAGTHGQSRYHDIPNPEEVQSVIYKAREARMQHIDAGGSGPAQTESRATQLDTISRLHDQGKLSDDEFESEKRRLLEGD